MIGPDIAISSLLWLFWGGAVLTVNTVLLHTGSLSLLVRHTALIVLLYVCSSSYQGASRETFGTTGGGTAHTGGTTKGSSAVGGKEGRDEGGAVSVLGALAQKV